MQQTVFEFTDYKDFLRHLSDSRPRGFRKSLAQATGCQTTYVSQVLNGSHHFSIEQAESATRYLEFSGEETRYFILLVEQERAGTASLKKYFGDQLNEVRERHHLIKERIGVSNALPDQHRATYYSSWHYAAVHMATTIPRLRTRPALAKALRIPSRKLGEILDFLESVGLLTKHGEQYATGSTLLHLPRDSAEIHRHHTNWRLQAINQLHSEHAKDDLHFSTVVSVSHADAEALKEAFLRMISDAARVIKESPEERLTGINVDLYRLDE